MRVIRPLTISKPNRVNKLNDLLYLSQYIRLQVTGTIPFWGSGNNKSTTTTKKQLLNVNSKDFLISSWNMHALRTYIF